MKYCEHDGTMMEDECDCLLPEQRPIPGCEVCGKPLERIQQGLYPARCSEHQSTLRLGGVPMRDILIRPGTGPSFPRNITIELGSVTVKIIDNGRDDATASDADSPQAPR